MQIAVAVENELGGSYVKVLLQEGMFDPRDSLSWSSETGTRHGDTKAVKRSRYERLDQFSFKLRLPIAWTRFGKMAKLQKDQCAFARKCKDILTVFLGLRLGFFQRRSQGQSLHVVTLWPFDDILKPSSRHRMSAWSGIFFKRLHLEH